MKCSSSRMNGYWQMGIGNDSSGINLYIYNYKTIQGLDQNQIQNLEVI